MHGGAQEQFLFVVILAFILIFKTNVGENMQLYML